MRRVYCDLKGSDPEFIRKLFALEEFVKFELPYCFRCPPAVVEVFNYFLSIVIKKGYLSKRLKKKFNSSPTKNKVAEKYPKVRIITTSIQKKDLNSNYFGKYIAQEISKLSSDEISESHDKLFPTVLIIGPKHFLKSITPFFDEEKIYYELKRSEPSIQIREEDGFRFLKESKNSNLGWRIILESHPQGEEYIKETRNNKKDFIDILPKDLIDSYLKKAEEFKEEEKNSGEKKVEPSKPKIMLTTFEGAKGLSAQHVFIVGLQNGVLPINFRSVRDIEICKFLVALTRARMQCHIMATNMFAGKQTEISDFIKWLTKTELGEIEKIKIDKNYWK